MKKISLICFLFLTVQWTFAQGVPNFSLKDALTGSLFELDEHDQAKAIVLVFTTINCPFSRLYEERIFQLQSTFSSKGYVFFLINPHAAIDSEENEAAIKKWGQERKMNFPFLMDPEQEVTQSFQISKLPEVVVLTSGPTGRRVVYRGAIDNNPQVAANANLRYLESALNAIENRRNPSPASSRPVGCNVRGVR